VSNGHQRQLYRHLRRHPGRAYRELRGQPIPKIFANSIVLDGKRRVLQHAAPQHGRTVLCLTGAGSYRLRRLPRYQGSLQISRWNMIGRGGQRKPRGDPRHRLFSIPFMPTPVVATALVNGTSRAAPGAGGTCCSGLNQTSAPVTVVVGHTYTMKFSLRGTVLSLWVSDNAVLSAAGECR